MRIGVLTSLYPGSTRPFEGLFAERRWLGMRARGHAVDVVQPLPLAPPFAERFGRGAWASIAGLVDGEERSGVTVRRPRYWHLPGRARGNARRFAAVGVRRLLREARPEVVVCDYAWPAAAAAPRLREAGVPCVVNGRGSDVLQVAGEAGLGDELAGYLGAAGRWCAVSQDLVDTMDRLAGQTGRGVLIENGVDLERFRPSDRNEARRELGLPLDGPLVLVVGHLIPRKDPLLALKAFQAGAPSGARAVFVGRGELAEDLKREAAADARSRGPERVHLAGEAPPERLATWYAACDLLLLTSNREGRPNVVLEALACGRPVLATRAGGTAELLVDAPRMLADTREPQALGERLASLLADPPDPDTCRALVAERSWESGLTRLEALLEEAAA